MAAAAKGFIQRLAALGRRKAGEPSRPLGDCCVVYQVSDENIEATRRADRGADPVDVWHDLPRLGNLESSSLDCIGSTRKQDRHFIGSKRLRHTAPVYPIPP